MSYVDPFTAPDIMMISEPGSTWPDAAIAIANMAFETIILMCFILGPLALFGWFGWLTYFYFINRKRK